MVTAETHAQMRIQCFIHVKVNFKEKNLVLPTEKFLFLALARNTIMLLNTSLSIFRFIICQVVAYGRLKTKENFKLFALKVVAVAYER